MNRVYKFRIWNGVEWVNPNKFTLEDLQKSKILDTYQIHQSVSLKDKNGKDIYEEDIVHFGYTQDTAFTGIVGYFDDRASYGVVSGNAFETFEGLMDSMEFLEVIGNTCENPELKVNVFTKTNTFNRSHSLD